MCHKFSQLEQGLHQNFGSKRCRQLEISQTACSPRLHQSMLYNHPVQWQHVIHCSYFLEPLRTVIPQAVNSLLLGFPSPDEIRGYQQRENIPIKRKHLLNQDTFSNVESAGKTCDSCCSQGVGRWQDQSGAECMQTTRVPPAALAKGNVKQEAAWKSPLLITQR